MLTVLQEFVDQLLITYQIDAVRLIYHNDIFTAVPESIYDEGYNAHYLKYNSRILSTDAMSTDQAAYDCNIVYVAFSNVNNYLYDKFGGFDYYHLASKILAFKEDSTPTDMASGLIVMIDQSFYLCLSTSTQLLALNLFHAQSKDDVLYYTLFLLEQNDIDPSFFTIEVLDRDKDSGVCELLSKYIRRVNTINKPTESLNQILCA